MRHTMRDRFDHALRGHAEHRAVEFGGQTLTYRDLDRWSHSVALQLHELGVVRGDRVAIYLRNRPEFIVADIAVARLGAVKVPVNFMLATDTVGHILSVTGVRAVVVDEPLRDSLTEALAGQSAAHPVVIVAAARPDSAVRAMVSLPTHDVQALPHVDVSPDDVAAIYFTGGTTGKPKGVVHTQASTVALHVAQIIEAELHDDERVLLTTPMAHAAGLFAQSAIMRGATAVLHDGFDVDDVVSALRDDAITWTFLVPTMIYRVLGALEDSGSTGFSLRTVVYGAAPMTAGRLERAIKLLGPVFVQLYGQTESPNWGTRLAKRDHDPDRPELLASCGRASLFAEVRIVDDDGGDVAAGEIGEVALRTPYLLREYLDNPGATTEKFLGDWIRTGDVGVLDEAGYLYLKDRKNDMVISGGMNVYCSEVEAVLAEHPDVREVAVIGVPHPDWGEAVHAVVVAGPGFDERAVLGWARDRLASYARPKVIATADALPETAFGKIDKRALREPYWRGTARAIG